MISSDKTVLVLTLVSLVTPSVPLLKTDGVKAVFLLIMSTCRVIGALFACPAAAALTCLPLTATGVFFTFTRLTESTVFGLLGILLIFDGDITVTA